MGALTSLMSIAWVSSCDEEAVFVPKWEGDASITQALLDSTLRSIPTADAHSLAARAGTGEQVGKIKVGEPGSKERVDFGETIGQFVEEGAAAGVDTSVGIIHYSKRGVHIVPARPK